MHVACKREPKKQANGLFFFLMKCTGSLLQVTRMDGALEHMRQFGFCDQLVRETVKELLKVGSYLFVYFFAKARTFMGSSPSKTPTPYSLPQSRFPSTKKGFFIYKKSKRSKFGLAHL